MFTKHRAPGPQAETNADGSPTSGGIWLYGAPWCGDTRRSKALLAELGVPFTDIDVDRDPAANAWITARQDGRRRIPLIVLAPDEPLLVEPSDDDLRAALVRTGYVSADAPQAAD